MIGFKNKVIVRGRGSGIDVTIANFLMLWTNADGENKERIVNANITKMQD